MKGKKMLYPPVCCCDVKKENKENDKQIQRNQGKDRRIPLLS